MLKRILTALALCFLTLPALAQGLIIGQPGQGLIIQNGGSSTLTIGTTAISGGTLNNCLTVGASNLLGQGSCGTTYTAGTGLTLTGSSFKLGDANLTYSGGVLTTTTFVGALTGHASLDLAVSGLGSNVQTALGLTLNGSGAVAATTSPTFVTPVLGAATGTSLAIGGCTLGTNAACVTGLSTFNGAATINGNGIESWSLGYFGFSSTTSPSGSVDVTLFRDGVPGALALQNGTNAQSIRVYNTWSSSGANYERGVFDWQGTANVLSIGTQNGGTGVARNLQFLVGGVNKLDYGITNAGAWTTSGNIYGTGNSSFIGYNAAAGTISFGGYLGYANGGGGPVYAGLASTGIFGWSSTTNFGQTPDISFSRSSAGVIGVGTGAQGSTAGTLKAAVLGTTTAYTVSTLPTGFAGARAYVTDAVACTFLGTLTGGGSAVCPVFYNGTSWIGG